MIKINKKQITKFVILITLSLVLNINIANATAQISLAVKSPNPYEGNLNWFVYTQTAGSKISDTVTVKNFSNSKTEVVLYAVDAISSDSGSFILSFQEEEQKGIGAWTNIKSKAITIDPFETMDIPFEIEIPKDVPPGQYIGGIVMEKNNNKEEKNKNNKNETTVEVKTRIGSRVYLTIPGEVVENVDFSSLKAKKMLNGTTRLFLTLENKGNMSYEPEARIEIFDQNGNLFETITKSLGTIAPMTTIKPIIDTTKKPFIGKFTVKTHIEFKNRFAPTDMHGSANYITKETSFLALPWNTILATLFILFIIVIIYTEKKLAKKRYHKKGEIHIVSNDEDIESLARTRNISWKKIAKHNNIKPPYTVKEGDKLILPKQK